MAADGAGADGAATIRAAEEADVAAIAAIYGHHVVTGTGSFETEPPTDAEMAGRLAALRASGHPAFVAAAAADGAVVAFATAGPYRPRPAYRDTVETSVYVRPDRAGRGIGSALLAALVDACERAGFRQMVAVVGDTANLASVRLHERHGFRLVGTLRAVGHKHGRWLDTVLLQRPLGPGDGAPPTRGGGAQPAGEAAR